MDSEGRNKPIINLRIENTSKSLLEWLDFREWNFSWWISGNFQNTKIMDKNWSANKDPYMIGRDWL